MKVVEKVWGKEEWIVNNDLYCFKKLYLNKDFRCSMHYHKIKDETFIIHSGKVLMESKKPECIEAKQIMLPGDQIRISPEENHRFTGLEDSVIYEISTQHFETDSYRLVNSGKVMED